MSGVVFNPYWNRSIIVCNNEYIIFWGSRVHQAHVEINHWAHLRCTLFPTEVPTMFWKNIKPCISIDGSLEVVSTKYGANGVIGGNPHPHPPPQKYLFHLLIPTWNRQDDAKRRLTYLLSAWTQRLGTTIAWNQNTALLCKGISFQEDQNWFPWNFPQASVHLF